MKKLSPSLIIYLHIGNFFLVPDSIYAYLDSIYDIINSVEMCFKHIWVEVKINKGKRTSKFNSHGDIIFHQF